jgi:hypothetical protein
MLSAEDAMTAANGGRVTYDASKVPLSDLKSLVTQVAGMGGTVTIRNADSLSDATCVELNALGFGKVSFVQGDYL